jgi:L-ascorbate metabolism protein UlaG (beta-lactamase superfamily)
MRALTSFIFITAIMLSQACTTTNANESGTSVDQKKSSVTFFSIMWKRFTNTVPHMEPSKPIPVHNPLPDLLDGTEDKLVKIGHSTVLMRIDEHWLITDPMFSERASPFSFVGPKRFHAPALALEHLPILAAVIISHDHYDHLDEASIKALANNTERFIVPARVDKHLLAWGIPKEKITVLDRWESTSLDSVTITATPSQHFSGRWLNDTNQTQWASWAIKGSLHNIFFSGDTGYFSGFKKIGDQLGPFDITLLEAGAYNEMWDKIHMFPEQTLQAHRDLRGKYMIPIHNSTFNLAFHPWFEPLEEIEKRAKPEDMVLTPAFGETVDIAAPKPARKWWQPLLPWYREESAPN